MTDSCISVVLTALNPILPTFFVGLLFFINMTHLDVWTKILKWKEEL